MGAGLITMMPVTILPRCSEAIEFYKRVLGAREKMRFPMPDGTVAHTELSFGPAIWMLADPMPGFEPAPTRLCLYTRDCDALFQRAVQHGATVREQPSDQFYGDRTARFTDPFGVEWTLMTHVEDVSVPEMKKRMAKLFGG